MAPAPKQDPLRYDAPLPLEAEFFPMGFSVRIATNSQRVIDAAQKVWGESSRLFDVRCSRIKVYVNDGGSRPQQPVLRGQEHLISIVGDQHNFAIADVREGFGHICISYETATDAAFLRYHFLEPLAYVLISGRHATLVHSSAIALHGRGVMLCGGSGSGKTCLAFACARAGWTFLSGDATAVVHGSDEFKIAGRPYEIRFRHTARLLFAELERFPRVLRPSGKTDIEIDPRVLGIACAPAATASLLVFLDQSGASRARPLERAAKPLEREDVRRQLEEWVCYGDEETRRLHGLALDRLAELPAVALNASDLSVAEKALRYLAQSHGQ
jgi:hypothetical protein